MNPLVTGVPTITSFSPTSGTTGTVVIISGTNFTSNDKVAFNGTAATAFTLNSSSSISATVGTGSTGTITVTNPGNNRTATSSGAFTFIPLPTITSFSPSSGNTGTVISIIGNNFTGMNSVTIGGAAAASYNVNSSTSISATVGSGSTGSICVSNTNCPGCQVSSSGSFTYIPPPPTITSFTPSSGGAGTVVSITGTNFITGATLVNFGGAQAQSVTVNSSSSISATVGGGNSGTISVTTSGGTANSTASFTCNYQTPTITSFGPPSGFTDSPIEIQGENLYGASSVCFGGTPASNFTIVNNGTEIIATVGNGSTGYVTVTNPAGTATSAQTFTYIGPLLLTSFTPSIGYDGAVVTIIGSGFTDATSVTFGGTNAASFSALDDNTIEAMVGMGTSGTISVTTPQGTVSSTQDFSYIPLPTIASFTPYCGATGTEVTITGSGFTSATDVTFGGVPATGFTVVNDSQLTASVGSGAYGPVSVTNPSGTAETWSDFVYIPPPTIASFNPSSGVAGNVVCINGANFTWATAVTFGGTAAAAFTVLSDTQINATVGNGASGFIGVTTPGGTATSSQSFTVYSSMPVANADAFADIENTPLNISAPGVLANDTNADGNPLTAALDSPAINGTVTLNSDGSFTYIPNALFFGTDSFTYSAKNGPVNSSPATVTITVFSIPTVSDLTFDIENYTSLTVDAPGVLYDSSNPDGNPITAEVVDLPESGELQLNDQDGSFSYTQNVGFIGTDNFSYAGVNGPAVSLPATVTINIYAPLTGVSLNVTPPPPQQTKSTISISAIATGGYDVNYQFLVYNPLASPVWSILQGFATNNICTWTPTSPGNYLITVIAQDGLNGVQVSNTASYTVPGLDAPIAFITSPTNGANFCVNGNGVDVTINASDPDGDMALASLTGSITGPQSANLQADAPYTCSSLHLGNWSAGNYAVSATATDYLGQSSNASPLYFAIQTPPTVNIASPTDGQHYNTNPATIYLQATASPGDAPITNVTFFVDKQAVTGNVEADGFTYTATTTNSINGEHLVSAAATDANGWTTTSISVTIVVVSQSPTVQLVSPSSGQEFYPINGASGAAVPVSANATGIDGTISTITVGINYPNYTGVSSTFNSTANTNNCSYSSTFQNVPLSSQSYSAYANAVDSLGVYSVSGLPGTSASFSVSPGVVIISPSNDPQGLQNQYIPGNDIDVSYVIYPNNIVNVCLYVDNIKMPSVNSPIPSFLVYSNSTQGQHALFVVATDNNGNSYYSATITILVNQPPTCSAWVSSSLFKVQAGSNSMAVPITVRAIANSQNGTIQKVIFYNEYPNNPIGECDTAPYLWTLTPNCTIGPYTIGAQAIDNLNGKSSISWVNFTVAGTPTVNITGPAPNSTFNIVNTGTVNITATSQDPNGFDGGIFGMQIFVADWNGTQSWAGGHSNCNGGSTASISYQWPVPYSSNFGAYATAVNNFGFVGGSTSTPFVVLNPPPATAPPSPPTTIQSNYVFIDMLTYNEKDLIYGPAIASIMPFVRSYIESAYGAGLTNTLTICLTGVDIWGDPKSNIDICVSLLETFCTIDELTPSEDGESEFITLTSNGLTANTAMSKVNAFLQTVKPSSSP